MSRKKFGSDLIVDVIKQYDFDYVSFNPGSSFRALHDSLVHHGGNVKPEIILCPHENTAVGIAHGYAKATEKPMLTILHNLVGTASRHHGHLLCLYRPGPHGHRRSHRSDGYRPQAAAYRLDPHRSRPGQCHQGLCEMGRSALFHRRRAGLLCQGLPHCQHGAQRSDLHLFRCHACRKNLSRKRSLCLNVSRLMPPTPIQADTVALEKAADLLVKAKNPVDTGRLPRKKQGLCRKTGRTLRTSFHPRD